VASGPTAAASSSVGGSSFSIPSSKNVLQSLLLVQLYSSSSQNKCMMSIAFSDSEPDSPSPEVPWPGVSDGVSDGDSDGNL